MKFDVKICGLRRPGDVALAARLGADYAGFVCFPGSPRYVEPALLAELVRELPPAVRKVGVFVDAPRSFIEDRIAAGALDVIQLHGHETATFAASFPGVEVWKAFHLTSDAEVEAARAFPAARLLADGVQPGGGKCCDWRYPERLARWRPVMQAGGINAANCRAALAAVRPAGLDLASGVESEPGVKDEIKMIEMMKIIKELRENE